MYGKALLEKIKYRQRKLCLTKKKKTDNIIWIVGKEKLK